MYLKCGRLLGKNYVINFVGFVANKLSVILSQRKINTKGLHHTRCVVIVAPLLALTSSASYTAPPNRCVYPVA
jgi:hypothetical protein